MYRKADKSEHSNDAKTTANKNYHKRNNSFKKEKKLDTKYLKILGGFGAAGAVATGAVALANNINKPSHTKKVAVAPSDPSETGVTFIKDDDHHDKSSHHDDLSKKSAAHSKTDDLNQDVTALLKNGKINAKVSDVAGNTLLSADIASILAGVRPDNKSNSEMTHLLNLVLGAQKADAAANKNAAMLQAQVNSSQTAQLLQTVNNDKHSDHTSIIDALSHTTSGDAFDFMHDNYERFPNNIINDVQPDLPVISVTPVTSNKNTGNDSGSIIKSDVSDNNIGKHSNNNTDNLMPITPPAHHDEITIGGITPPSSATHTDSQHAISTPNQAHSSTSSVTSTASQTQASQASQTSHANSNANSSASSQATSQTSQISQSSNIGSVTNISSEADSIVDSLASAGKLGSCSASQVTSAVDSIISAVSSAQSLSPDKIASMATSAADSMSHVTSHASHASSQTSQATSSASGLQHSMDDSTGIHTSGTPSQAHSSTSIATSTASQESYASQANQATSSANSSASSQATSHALQASQAQSVASNTSSTMAKPSSSVTKSVSTTNNPNSIASQASSVTGAIDQK